MSSSSSSSSSSGHVTATPLDGHVWLILLQEGDEAFYLEVPLEIIESLCLKPRKYLLFLGWCILGLEGILSLEDGGDAIDTEGNLDNVGIYHYVSAATKTNLTQAVDLEVIKVRTSVSSQTTRTRDDFRKTVLERDTCCVWTGVYPANGEALHIIPFARGSEWLQLIVENRPKYGEDVEGLTNINDIRNGIFAYSTIHKEFDPRRLVVLKTPNHILGIEDIPMHTIRRFWPPNVGYPTGSRYTLQYMVTPDPSLAFVAPSNNIDATFKRGTKKPKPSELLLHYNYGAAAVKNWGRGIKFFQRHMKPSRISEPAQAPTEPPRTVNDKSIGIQKHAARPAPGTGSGRIAAGVRTTESVDPVGQEVWDEDDVMLFLWGNTPAAKERHLKKEQENTRRLEEWREGVAYTV